MTVGADPRSSPCGGETRLALAEMFEVPGWRRRDPPPGPPPAQPPATWAVVDLGFRHTPGLIARLSGPRQRVIVVEGDARLDRVLPALAAAARDGQRARLMVLAGAGAAAAAPAPVQARAAIAGPVRALADLGARLSGDGAGWALDLVVVTTGAVAVGGEDVRDPFAAMVTGACRVLPTEVPRVRCRHVDFSFARPGARALERLGWELAHGHEPEVALRESGRHVRVLEPRRLAGLTGPSPWRDGGTYLITGGLGGIGLVLAEDLARRHGANVALVGRRRPRAHEAGERSPESVVRGMERLGAAVAVHSADVADAEAMARVRDDVHRRFGALDGLVHAAGVWPGPHAGLLEARTPRVADDVLRAKVFGTLTLDAVFGASPPRLVVLCSSIASFIGGYGLADYTAGSAFLDAYARWDGRRLPEVVSVNWGGWEEVGMWAPHRGRSPGLRNDEGPEALRRALADGRRPQVVISPVRTAAIAARRAPSDPPAAGDGHDGGTVDALCALWAEVLGRDRVQADEDFFALGGDSLAGVDLVWRIADVTGTKVPVRAVRACPTPAAMAAAIVSGAGW